MPRAHPHALRCPSIDLGLAHANHQRRIGRVPFAVLLRDGAMEERFVRASVQEAKAVAAVGDDQEALICVPCLRARIAMPTISWATRNARRESSAWIGNASEARAEDRIVDGLEIVWAWHRRRRNYPSSGKLL